MNMDRRMIATLLAKDRLQAVLVRRDQVAQALGAMDLAPAERESLGAEYAHLHDLSGLIDRYQQTLQQIEDVTVMLGDASIDTELRTVAQEELEALRVEQDAAQQRLVVKLAPRDDQDDASVILEVRSGSGGLEAGLFAGDLFRMYVRYASVQQWSTEQLDINEDTGGAIKRVILEINGRGAYSRLKFESGVHRVQRVPVTEASGRIHTSAASVVVLPKPRPIDVKIDDKDLRIDTFRAQGAGGQHVNKTDSAVRITHLPTGIVVQCQDDKSQHRNKDRAMQVLRARLYDFERQKEQGSQAAERRQMIGSGDRSERIRTYNFPQGRITDHRIGLTLHKLDKVLSGEGLDELVDALSLAAESERLSTSVQEAANMATEED